MKYIKNADIIDHTYEGQTITPGQYYLIQPLEEARMANNSTLLTDIGSAKAVISKADGSGDITDVAEAINWLKDIHPQDDNGYQIIAHTTFSVNQYRFRGKGVNGLADKAVDAQTPKVTNIDYDLTEMRYLNGGQVILKNHHEDDTMTFQVLYNNGTDWVVADEYITDWAVDDVVSQQPSILLPYIAKITSGLRLRIAYKAHGTTNDVKVKINYYLQKDY